MHLHQKNFICISCVLLSVFYNLQNCKKATRPSKAQTFIKSDNPERGIGQSVVCHRHLVIFFFFFCHFNFFAVFPDIPNVVKQLLLLLKSFLLNTMKIFLPVTSTAISCFLPLSKRLRNLVCPSQDGLSMKGELLWDRRTIAGHIARRPDF